jgi:hypothetical protein
MPALTEEQIAEIKARSAVHNGKKYDIGVIQLLNEDTDALEYVFVYRKKLSRDAYSKCHAFYKSDIVTALEVAINDVAVRAECSPEFFERENWELMMAVNPFIADLMEQKKTLILS